MVARKPIKITINDSDDSGEQLASVNRQKRVVKKKVKKNSPPKNLERKTAPKTLSKIKATPIKINEEPTVEDKILPSRAKQAIKKSLEDISGDDAVKSVIASSLREDEEKEEEKGGVNKIVSRRSINLYRRIAVIFLTLTLVLVAVIFYYLFVKVTITIIPTQERVSNNMIFDVYNEDADIEDAAGAIAGQVKVETIEHTETYLASGEEIIGEEATGKVVMINNYNKNQPLVATTRLLTPDNKLFRTSNTVNIPAGGSVEVEIYADVPGPEMSIEPTRFTIPGLWAGLQDKIYAENKEKIEYKQKIKHIVTELDIKNAITAQREKLINAAKSQINDDYKEFGQLISKIDENSIASDTDTEAGDEKDEFSITTVADVLIVAFDDEPATKLAKQKFVSALPDNKELIEFDESKIVYTLNNYEEDQGIASINATFEGKTSLKNNSSVIDVNNILGLTREQLETYLNSKPEIAGFEIEFYPNFLPAFMQKVPKIVDRISIPD